MNGQLTFRLRWQQGLRQKVEEIMRREDGKRFYAAFGRRRSPRDSQPLQVA